MKQNLDNLLIHIGYHKTATAWLQQKLFISDNNIFEPVSTKSKGHSTLADHFIYDNDGYLLSSFELNDARIQTELENIYKGRYIPETKIPVISHERLSGNPHASGFDANTIATRLNKIFPKAKILIGIREQKDFIFSNYFQYLSIGGTNNLRKYLETKYDGRRPFFSPDHIKYLALIKEYFRLFGKENVLVLPYEMFRESPELYINKLEKFLNVSININEGSFRDVVNTKQFLSAMYYMKFLNVFQHSTSINGYSSVCNNYTRIAASSLQKALNIFFPKRLDDSLRKKLNLEIDNWCGNRYHESNKELSEAIGVDLSQYGYFFNE